MRPYSTDNFKHKDILRSTTKTAKLVAKNADRSKKKTVRNKLKGEMNREIGL